jgi:hypothetical protein
MLTSEEKTPLEQILFKLDELDKRLAKIEKYLERQKGFIGGVLFIGAGVAWLIDTVKDWIR